MTDTGARAPMARGHMHRLTRHFALLYRVGAAAAILALGLVAAVSGYGLVRNQVAGEIYRERLQTLAGDYERLLERHNEAVRRTAVTELVVEGERLSVAVRTAEGVVRTVQTPFDPEREIYVDFVVVQGRLLIRRVFDSRTAPEGGLVIEPLLEEVDWDDARMAVGKAVYRRLGEGRWVVTVTGDGSLGLARAQGDEPAQLAAAPEVREYDEEAEREVKSAVEGITFGDVVRRWARP